MQPRPYQEQVIDTLRHMVAKNEEPGLLVAPTGSGKSEIAGYIARLAVSRGFRVGFLVNRRILVKDLARRVERLGMDFGIIMGAIPGKPWAKVHVASFDTLWRRETLPRWDLVFVDEAHFSLAEKYATVIERLRASGSRIIGMTATPVRGDGRGLGKIYKWMVRCPDTPDLIERGYLVRPRVFAPSQPDLRKVSVTAGEYNQRELAEAVDRSTLTGDILTHWIKNLRGRPTIGFGVTIAHCEHMAEMFRGAGVRAVAVDHRYKGDLDLVWSKLASYETEVVFNVGLAGYGWDCPPVSAMIEARPTKSLGLWLQHAGRIMRIADGKTDAVINDHAGNTLQFGLPDEPRDWDLDDGVAAKAGDRKLLGVTTCIRPVKIDGVLRFPCYATFRIGPKECPYCGLPLTAKQRPPIEVEAGELEEVTKAKTKAQAARDYRLRERYRELVLTQQTRGYKPGWIALAFRQEFGQWPSRKFTADLK